MYLPLFLLSTIVFPGSAIPLHIFEERYKQLINESWRSKKPFGISLSADGKLYDVGCIVEIADVMTRYDDGKMDIIITGSRRFKMNHFSSGEKPYFIAEAEYYDDDETAISQLLLSNAIHLFNKIAKGITSTSIKQIFISELDKVMPSFQIALKSGLTLEQKQKLIESKSENSRLEMLLAHLNTLNLIVEEADIANAIIKNDGYFQASDFNL